MRIVNTSEDQVLISANLVELLQQHINSGWARTWHHLDLRILGAIRFSVHHISHVILSNHRRLVLWEVETIANKCLIQISTVLHHLGELIDRELEVGVALHVKYAEIKYLINRRVVINLSIKINFYKNIYENLPDFPKPFPP